MITFLRGIIKDINDSTLTLDVQGIGYGVTVCNSTAFIIGEKAELFIQLIWHQEQGPHLFGFTTHTEKTIFCLITSCSGFGPKAALAILQAMTPSAFIEAIELGNTKALSAVNGVGTKKAESIILHLKDKVHKLIQQGFCAAQSTTSSLSVSDIKNLTDVLNSLGYSAREISDALTYVRSQGSAYAFDELLRKSLSFLSKRL